MENQILPLINEQIYANNNNLLLELMNKLENLMRDTNDNVVIQRIKDIIIITNKIITNCNQIRQDIQNLNTNLNLRFTSLELKLQNNSSGSANLNNINNNNNNFDNNEFDIKIEEMKLNEFIKKCDYSIKNFTINNNNNNKENNIENY